MRKPTKTVPREQFEAMKNSYFASQAALDAVLNHETEFPLRIKASELGGIKEASKYTFRFVPKQYSTLVIATFSTIGQRASSTVYDLDQQNEYCQRKPMTWAQFEQAQRNCYLSDPPTQITAAKFQEMLEVLPPNAFECRGDLVSFLMCEHYSGPYTHQYVKRGNGIASTYWTRMVDATDRATWMTHESHSTIEAAALDVCMSCGVQMALMVKPYGTWQRGECDACKSGHHCDKRCGRQARPGSDLCGKCGSVTA